MRELRQRGLLRLRRHLLRQISRRSRARWSRTRPPTSNDRRPAAAGRRHGLPHEHGRQAEAAGFAVESRHIAEVLAGWPSAPAIGSNPEPSMDPTSLGFQARPRALGNPSAKALSGIKTGWRGRPSRARRTARIRRLRDLGRDIKNHASPISTSISNLRAKATRPAARCTGPRCRRGAAASCSSFAGRRRPAVTKSKRMIAEEIGLNALARGRTTWSRPISASTLSSCATPPTTSSGQPCTAPTGPGSELFRSARRPAVEETRGAGG